MQKYDTYDMKTCNARVWSALLMVTLTAYSGSSPWRLRPIRSHSWMSEALLTVALTAYILSSPWRLKLIQSHSWKMKALLTALTAYIEFSIWWLTLTTYIGLSPWQLTSIMETLKWITRGASSDSCQVTLISIRSLWQLSGHSDNCQVTLTTVNSASQIEIT